MTESIDSEPSATYLQQFEALAHGTDGADGCRTKRHILGRAMLEFPRAFTRSGREDPFEPEDGARRWLPAVFEDRCSADARWWRFEAHLRASMQSAIDSADFQALRSYAGWIHDYFMDGSHLKRRTTNAFRVAFARWADAADEVDKTGEPRDVAETLSDDHTLPFRLSYAAFRGLSTETKQVTAVRVTRLEKATRRIAQAT